MCGRFCQVLEGKIIFEDFQIENFFDINPSYNVAPNQNAAVIIETEHDKKRFIKLHKWGLIPSWSKSIKNSYKMINARSETINQKPSFKNSIKSKRCLIPVNYFYEWQKLGSTKKQPFCIGLKDFKYFVLAGIWDLYFDGQNKIYSFSIITKKANKLVSKIHDRMPVIITSQNYNEWLNPLIDDLDIINKIMHTNPDDQMIAYPVSSFVNNPRNNSEKCIEKIRVCL